MQVLDLASKVMKKNNKSIILLALAAVLLTSSCVSYKPYASSVSDSDYNQRVEATDPQFKKKPNAFGYIVEIGLPVVGATVGAVTTPLIQHSDENRQNFIIGSAVLGALVGTGGSYIANKACGYGKMVKADDRQKWVKKAFGEDYILLSNSETTVRAINRNVESHYLVKNIDDVKDFASVFPNSRYESDMLAQALQVIQRHDIPTVVNLYPQSENVISFQQQYIKTSSSYNELFAAERMYPNALSDAEFERLYVDVVENPANAIAFHDKYPQSEYNATVILNAISSTILTDDEIEDMNDAYGSQLQLDQKTVASASNKVRENYYNLMFQASNPTTTSQIDNFNKSYTWLKFDNKKHTVVAQAWNVAYKNGKNGTDIIAQAGKIVGKNYSRDLGIDYNYFQEFVKEELEKEKDKIKIVSQNHLNSMSDEFERWKRSAYSAGVVRTEELQFLVYGEIQNESRFDLPVAVAAGGVVVQTQKIESGGLLGGVINFLGAITNTETSHKQTLGIVRSPNFIIPLLQAGTTMPYAILIKFKDSDVNGQAGGVNFVDLMKVSSEITLENIQVQSVVWNGDIPDDEVLKEQNEWVQMAVNGMPQAKVVDLWRNKEFRQDTWDEEWSEILRSASSGGGYSSSSSSSSVESSSVPDKETILSMITDRSEWSKDWPFDYYWQKVTFSDGTEINVCKEILDNRVRYGHPGGLLTGDLAADWYDTYEDAVVAFYLSEKYGD